MQITIKKVSEGTFPVLAKLSNELALHQGMIPLGKEGVDRLRTDCLSKNPKFEAYIGYFKNKPVAYMVTYMKYSTFLALPTLQLGDLFIEEEYRRKGIGQTLFDFAKEIAKKRGCGRLEVNGLTWNTPAVRFYEKNNMHIVKDLALFRLDIKNKIYDKQLFCPLILKTNATL